MKHVLQTSEKQERERGRWEQIARISVQNGQQQIGEAAAYHCGMEFPVSVLDHPLHITVVWKMRHITEYVEH